MRYRLVQKDNYFDVSENKIGLYFARPRAGVYILQEARPLLLFSFQKMLIVQ